jgi:hypothetical protein
MPLIMFFIRSGAAPFSEILWDTPPKIDEKPYETCNQRYLLGIPPKTGTLKYLVENGLNPKSRVRLFHNALLFGLGDQYSRPPSCSTPLLSLTDIAQYSGNTDFVNFLIDKGADRPFDQQTTRLTVFNAEQILGSDYREKETLCIPNNITAIDEWCFAGCKALKHLTFEQDSLVKAIEEHSFSGCSSLESIYIPKSVEILEKSCFEGCEKLEKVEFEVPNKVTGNKPEVFFGGNWSYHKLRIGRKAFFGCYSLRNIVMPKNVSYLGESCFEECKNLKNVTITADNTDLTKIGYRAFFGCSSLENIVIPKNVNYLGESCFEECEKLRKVEFANNDKLGKIEKKTFSNCSSLESIRIVGASFSPHRSTSTEEGVVSKCANFEKMKLISIEEDAFSGCANLDSVVIPYSVRFLDDGCFSNCVKLKKVEFAPNTFPSKKEKGLIRIGKKTFSECSELTEINIPESVRVVDAYCFDNCTKLNVTFENINKLELLGRDAFLGCPPPEVQIPDSVIHVDPNNLREMPAEVLTTYRKFEREAGKLFW